MAEGKYHNLSIEVPGGDDAASEEIARFVEVGAQSLQCRQAAPALDAYRRAQELLEARGEMSSELGLSVTMGVGSARLLQGELEEATAAYETARGLLEARDGGVESDEGLAVLVALGSVWTQRKEHDRALQEWEAARRIRQRLGTLETADGASLLTNIGIVKRITGDSDGAMAAYTEARRIHLAVSPYPTGTPITTPRLAGAPYGMTPSGMRPTSSGGYAGACGGAGFAPVVDPATLMTEQPSRPMSAKRSSSSELGGKEAEMSPEQLRMMQAAYEEEKHMMEATHTLDTPSGAELMMNLGIVRRLQGDLDGAAEAYKEARRINAATGAGSRPGTASSRPGTAASRPGMAATRPGTAVLGSPMGRGPSFGEDAEVSATHLAAGSPLQAARQAHRLEAKLEILRGPDAHGGLLT